MEKKDKEKEFSIKDIPVTPNFKFEKRPVDYVKFNNLFNRPLERASTDSDWIHNTLGEETWLTFWAWRAWCLDHQMSPKDEILFLEFSSIFNIDEIHEIFGKYFIGEQELEKLKKEIDRLKEEIPKENNK